MLKLMKTWSKILLALLAKFYFHLLGLILYDYTTVFTILNELAHEYIKEIMQVCS